MKKGFTLVELIVVVGIICILAGILIASFSGGIESARSAKCLTNMRNLAAACQTYGMANSFYPAAGSFEKIKIDEGTGNARKVFYNHRGWISWNCGQAYDSRPQSHVASSSWFTSCYEEDDERSRFALTNGVLWKYVSANSEVYVCPKHRIVCQEKGANAPVWSYVMNEYFKWDDTSGSRAKSEDEYGREYGNVKNADKRLLFAEIPFVEGLGDIDFSASPGTEHDCTLQYKHSEIIGFNHSAGKAGLCAHVAFADGHTEKIMMPKGGMTIDDARNLTRFLCDGKDYTLENGRFKELK